MPDQKRKMGEGDSMSFVCFDTRSHPRKRAQGLCVCVCTDTPPQQEPFCRLLLYDLQLSSYVPPLAPPLSHSVNENLANSSPPPTIPQPSASPITPSLFSGEPGDTSAHSQSLCGWATAAPSRAESVSSS